MRCFHEAWTTLYAQVRNTFLRGQVDKGATIAKLTRPLPPVLANSAFLERGCSKLDRTVREGALWIVTPAFLDQRFAHLCAREVWSLLQFPIRMSEETLRTSTAGSKLMELAHGRLLEFLLESKLWIEFLLGSKGLPLRMWIAVELAGYTLRRIKIIFGVILEYV